MGQPTLPGIMLIPLIRYSGMQRGMEVRFNDVTVLKHIISVHRIGSICRSDLFSLSIDGNVVCTELRSEWNHYEGRKELCVYRTPHMGGSQWQYIGFARKHSNDVVLGFDMAYTRRYYRLIK